MVGLLTAATPGALVSFAMARVYTLAILVGLTFFALLSLRHLSGRGRPKGSKPRRPSGRRARSGKIDNRRVAEREGQRPEFAWGSTDPCRPTRVIFLAGLQPARAIRSFR